MKQLLLILFLVTITLAESTFLSTLSRLNQYDAETSALGECGVAFSSQLGSSLLNPANGVLYGNEQDVSISVSSGIGYLNEDTIDNSAINGMIGYFPTFNHPNIRMGVVITNDNHNLQYDDVIMVDGLYEEPTAIGNTHINHEAHTSTASVSLAWNEYLSLGLGVQILSTKSDVEMFIKPTFSSLLEGITSIQEIEKISEPSLDLGLRAQYPFYFSNSFFIKPALGFSALRLGNDSINVSSSAVASSDLYYWDTTINLSSRVLFGTSLSMGVENRFWGTFLFDSHREVLKKDIVTHSIGLQMGLTPAMQLNGGYLTDSDSLRKELHIGATVGYRSQQMKQYLRSKGRDLRSSSKLHNLQVLYSFSLINDLNDDDVERGGQQFHQLSFAVALKGKKEQAPHRAQTKRTIDLEPQRAISYSYEESELPLVK